MNNLYSFSPYTYHPTKIYFAQDLSLPQNWDQEKAFLISVISIYRFFSTMEGYNHGGFNIRLLTLYSQSFPLILIAKPFFSQSIGLFCQPLAIYLYLSSLVELLRDSNTFSLCRLSFFKYSTAVNYRSFFPLDINCNFDMIINACLR